MTGCEDDRKIGSFSVWLIVRQWGNPSNDWCIEKTMDVTESDTTDGIQDLTHERGSMLLSF